MIKNGKKDSNFKQYRTLFVILGLYCPVQSDHCHISYFQPAAPPPSYDVAMGGAPPAANQVQPAQGGGVQVYSTTMGKQVPAQLPRE